MNPSPTLLVNAMAAGVTSLVQLHILTTIGKEGNVTIGTLARLTDREISLVAADAAEMQDLGLVASRRPFDTAQPGFLILSLTEQGNRILSAPIRSRKLLPH